MRRTATSRTQPAGSSYREIRRQETAARVKASCNASSALASAAESTRSNRGYSAAKNSSNALSRAGRHERGVCRAAHTEDTPQRAQVFGRTSGWQRGHQEVVRPDASRRLTIVARQRGHGRRALP